MYNPPPTQHCREVLSGAIEQVNVSQAPWEQPIRESNCRPRNRCLLRSTDSLPEVLSQC